MVESVRRVLMIAVFAALLAVVPAQAVTLVNLDGSVAQPYQSWADEAKVPTVQTTVTVKADVTACAGSTACAWPGALRISCTFGQQCRDALLHELGHHYDFSMPEWKRRVFAKITTRRADAWLDGRNSLAEQFAVAYSLCAVGRLTHSYPQADGSRMTVYGYQYKPTARQQRRVCRLITS